MSAAPSLDFEHIELMRSRGWDESFTAPAYQYDPLSIQDRAALDALVAARSAGGDYDALSARMAQVLDPYVQQRQVGVSLWPHDLGEPCYVPPCIRVVNVHSEDGTCTVMGGHYDQLCRWLASNGYRVVCERLYDGDSIVFDGKGYTLVDGFNDPVCTVPTLTEARELHHSLHPLEPQ